MNDHKQKLPCITHNIYNLPAPYGKLHSLTINGVEGMRVGYNVVARNGIYAATTPYFANELPKLFLISNLTGMPSYNELQHDKLPDVRYPHKTVCLPCRGEK